MGWPSGESVLDNGAVKDRVLRAFLGYVMKDGQLQETSNDLLDYLLQTLDLDRQRYEAIVRELEQHFLAVGCHKPKSDDTVTGLGFLETMRTELS